MQVSQIAELDSHAVIGGGPSQSFFMANSAEFFTILSDTLYRDKKLAVVRETVCNAYDAHVMGNCLDKPIEITLSDHELMIKDFGPGIAADRMHGVYCGYGVSTKVDDKTQIGGFGLGCKAPFAYSDHFSVTSCHGGLRTVYSISRGGLESDGKPAMRQMIQVPNQETGITVSIPIKIEGDVREFERIIKQVVKNGGMKATLNGVALETHNFTGIEKTGFGIMPDNKLLEGPVYVRLGSVLYPLTTDHPELSKLVQVFDNNNSIKLILWAQPGEVGVTPSREALSYSEGTIAYLTERLNKARRHIMGLMPKVLRTMAERQVRKSTNPRVDTTLDNKALEIAYQTVDPEKVAAVILGVAYKDHWSNEFSSFKSAAGVPEKALLKAAMRKHRDYRAVFRRAAGKGQKFVSNRHYSSCGEWYGESGSLLIRTCVRLGILEHVARYAHKRDSKGLSVKPIKQCADAWPKKPSIVFCRTRAQADGHCAGSYSKNRSIAYIVTQRLKSHQIDEAEKLLIQKGFDCERLNLDKPAPQPKAPKIVKPKETYYSLADIDASRYCANLKKGAGTYEAAPVFLECGNIRDGEFQASMRDLMSQKKLILMLYPKVSLAIGANQMKALIKAGSRNLKDVFTEEYKALAKTPEILKAFLAGQKCLFKNPGRENPCTSIANSLSAIDLRFMKLLTGERLTVSNEEERAFVISCVLRQHRLLLSDHVFNSNFRDATNKIQIKKADLSFLNPIVAIWNQYYNYDETVIWTDDLCEIIRFLQRRHTNSKTKSNLQLVKEAA